MPCKATARGSWGGLKHKWDAALAYRRNGNNASFDELKMLVKLRSSLQSDAGRLQSIQTLDKQMWMSKILEKIGQRPQQCAHLRKGKTANVCYPLPPVVPP